jgi:uncharacterized membrane protein (UPF0127 family)
MMAGRPVPDAGSVALGLVSLVLLLVSLAACNRANAPGSAATTHAVVTFAGGSSLAVRVADTPEERTTGLMDVMALPEGDGMAFVYDEPSTDTYWMKDTLIPLSIAFVGDDGAIIAIRDMAPCRADPCATYGAGEPFTMAVEANVGWFGKHAVGVGDQARLEEPS